MRIRILATLALVASCLPVASLAQSTLSPAAPPAQGGTASTPDRTAPASPAAPPSSPGALPSSTPAPAAPDAPATQAEVRALSEEVRRLKLEMGVPGAVESAPYPGMGSSASKVYQTTKGLSIGGYGELVYSNDITRHRAYTEVLRLTLYVGYRFSDKIVFNAEVEFEHGAKEIGIEFAYVDFLFADALRLRVGNVLVPVGFLNENHEPIFFYGVFRPRVDQALIPTTWSQMGVGLYGDLGPLRYKAYFMTGLDVFGEEPLQAATWIRNAKTGEIPARANTFAGVLNLNADVGPATFGGSLYGGQAGQGERTAGGQLIAAPVFIGEVHALVAWRGLQARGIMAWGSLGDAGLVSEKLGLTGYQVIGSRTWGGYLEAGYDVLTLLDSSMSLTPFFRFEALNLQAAVPAGGLQDPLLNQRIIVAGLDFKPIPQVVVKADWQRTGTQAGSGAFQQVDLGVGFVF
jgi:hypothetical protein